MYKVLYLFVLAFMFVMPHVSAANLLKVDAPTFYQQIMASNAQFDDSERFRYSELLDGRESNERIVILMKNDAHTIVTMRSDEHGMVQAVIMQSSPINGPESNAIFSQSCKVVSRAIGLTDDEFVALLISKDCTYVGNAKCTKVWADHLKQTVELMVGKSEDESFTFALFAH